MNWGAAGPGARLRPALLLLTSQLPRSLFPVAIYTIYMYSIYNPQAGPNIFW
jgi:hypothetical protein